MIMKRIKEWMSYHLLYSMIMKRRIHKLDLNSHEDEVQNHKLNQSLIFKITVLSWLFIFMFVYVGLEVAYGNLFFTVAVTGPLQLSKLQVTVIQSLFWGTFAFTRIISIVLALFNVRSCGNLECLICHNNGLLYSQRCSYLAGIGGSGDELRIHLGVQNQSGSVLIGLMK